MSSWDVLLCLLWKIQEICIYKTMITLRFAIFQNFCYVRSYEQCNCEWEHSWDVATCTHFVQQARILTWRKLVTGLVSRAIPKSSMKTKKTNRSAGLVSLTFTDTLFWIKKIWTSWGGLWSVWTLLATLQLKVCTQCGSLYFEQHEYY